MNNPHASCTSSNRKNLSPSHIGVSCIGHILPRKGTGGNSEASQSDAGQTGMQDNSGILRLLQI